MSLEALREVTKTNRWLVVARAVIASEQCAVSSEDDFGTYWIEAGHRIREQVSDDNLLTRMLRQLLPPYGAGPVILYRGENLGRWQAKNVGFSWTEDPEVARMFGRGLNATRTGGILLRGVFQPTSIICGPNSHSNYLQEAQFTVDPSMLPRLEDLERYPPL